MFLCPGMVVSNEPGYYEENNFGIRCENLILVKEIDEINGKKLLGFEDLTLVPFDQRLINLKMLNYSEIEWINDYHKNVWKKISPLTNGNVNTWLKNATKSI